MKKFIFLFVAILMFDLIFVSLYDQIFINFEPAYLKIPLLIIKYLVSAPAIFFNELLPFYLPLPTYQSVLIFFANIFFQTFLIYSIFFSKVEP
jgi:hypothetical protein